MMCRRIFLTALLTLITCVASFGAQRVPVSLQAQQCINTVLEEGADAVGHRGKLNYVYDRYFLPVWYAQLALGGDTWNRIKLERRDGEQLDLIKRFITGTVIQRFREYRDAKIEYLYEILGAHNREIIGNVRLPKGKGGTKRVVWYMPRTQCAFYDLGTPSGQLSQFIPRLAKQPNK